MEMKESGYERMIFEFQEIYSSVSTAVLWFPIPWKHCSHITEEALTYDLNYIY